MKDRSYIAIDLKSFYASVECVERGLDPMTTHLVVADETRTEKTICLAVSPSLKAYGIPGRARLFEVIQQVKMINAKRRSAAPGHRFTGKSSDAVTLQNDPNLELDYIIAPPHMAHYIEFSTRIYNIYLKYLAPEDIHVYSIDEVFMDVTNYLRTYGLTPRELAMKIILDVLDTTGVTATAGIGTNLYLCKVAMDIEAKHSQPDEHGVRIAEFTEMSYRQRLWDHRPLTDFWRVGKGYARKLEAHGMYTMGDIARRSTYDEDTLYKLFGINAELLIDHAWGWESCTMADIKAYRPTSKSISFGQVLQRAYPAEKAKLVAREMADMVALDLVDKGLLTDQIILTVGYDRGNLADPQKQKAYQGEVITDSYGRAVPKHAHGTINLGRKTASSKIIVNAVTELYDRIVNRDFTVRRLNVVAGHVINEQIASENASFEQMDLFTDYEEKTKQDAELEREKRLQKAMLHIKKKYGKNAILKGMNLEKGATAKERNEQIGGHKA